MTPESHAPLLEVVVCPVVSMFAQRTRVPFLIEIVRGAKAKSTIRTRFVVIDAWVRCALAGFA